MQAVKRKFDRFAQDADFRERYLSRVRSIKPGTGTPTGPFADDARTPDRRPGGIDAAAKPKAIIVHHVARSAPPPAPGSYPGSPTYFSPSRSMPTAQVSVPFGSGVF